ncbi:MAG TPA: kelch repeat-containing protein, partial [Thermoplasmata archaeon]|nr:kelch repeat-containing protein [Thermoplasmata archaeon]
MTPSPSVSFGRLSSVISAAAWPATRGRPRAGSFPSFALALAAVTLMVLPGSVGTHAAAPGYPAVAAAISSVVDGAAELLAAQESLALHQGPAALPHSGNSPPTAPASTNWSLDNISASAPAPRQLFTMAYDPTDGYVVLFGGGNVNSGTFYNDTWTFRNGSWNELFPAVSPPARRSAVMTWDAADGYLVLFGGLYFDDTWTFVGGNWTSRTAAVINSSNTPSTRWNAQMAYDPGTSSVILFGGCDQLACAGSTNDTWSYAAGTWTNVTAPGAAAPSVRGTSTLVWYPPDSALLLFGGSTPAQTVLGDTWEYGSSGWVQLTPATSPPARGDQWTVYDSVTSQLLLFGGLEYSVSPSAYAVGDTWTYQNASWTNQTMNNSVAPPSLWGEQSAGVWDGADQCAILFGGDDSNDVDLGQTWGYGCAFSGNSTGGGGTGSGGNGTGGGNWSVVNAGGAGSPAGREFFSMAYDPVDQYVVMFGGGTAVGPGQQYNDTWTFANGSWTYLNISSPAPRRSAAMTWDAADGYVLLFGGIYPGSATVNSVQFQDTWSFVHGAWHNMTAPVVNSTNTPTVRWMAQMAYDPTSSAVILFGGCNALACASSTNDTWSYSGGAWTNISGSVGIAPPVRGTASLVWYPPDNALLLFGGSNPNQTVRGDTWELSASGWTQLSPATSPSTRGDFWMVYDPTAGYLVLFGGLRYSVSPTDYALSDTWIYGNGTWTNETANNPTAPPALA